MRGVLKKIENNVVETKERRKKKAHKMVLNYRKETYKVKEREQTEKLRERREQRLTERERETNRERQRERLRERWGQRLRERERGGRGRRKERDEKEIIYTILIGMI